MTKVDLASEGSSGIGQGALFLMSGSQRGYIHHLEGFERCRKPSPVSFYVPSILFNSQGLTSCMYPSELVETGSPNFKKKQDVFFLQNHMLTAEVEGRRGPKLEIAIIEVLYK